MVHDMNLAQIKVLTWAACGLVGGGVAWYAWTSKQGLDTRPEVDPQAARRLSCGRPVRRGTAKAPGMASVPLSRGFFGCSRHKARRTCKGREMCFLRFWSMTLLASARQHPLLCWLVLCTITSSPRLSPVWEMHQMFGHPFGARKQNRTARPCRAFAPASASVLPLLVCSQFANSLVAASAASRCVGQTALMQMLAHGDT